MSGAAHEFTQLPHRAETWLMITIDSWLVLSKRDKATVVRISRDCCSKPATSMRTPASLAALAPVAERTGLNS